MAQSQLGSKLPRDYTSVIEVTTVENADHNKLMLSVSEKTIFSHQKQVCFVCAFII
jgi:hypothetical protein